MVDKMLPPSYQETKSNEFPIVTNKSYSCKIIAGVFGIYKSPIETRTGVQVFDIKIEAGNSFEHKVPEKWHGLIYVISGDVIIGDTIIKKENAGVLSQFGKDLTIKSETEARVLYIAGEKIGENVV